MSIIASVTVHDAIVIGADSQTTLMGLSEDGQATTMQSYQHAQKIHRIGDLAVGAWGNGNIGPRSVGSVLSEFAQNRDLSSRSVQETAAVLSDHLNGMAAEYQQAGWPQSEIGAIVGGYSPSQQAAETWGIGVPEPVSPTQVAGPFAVNANWWGVSVPFSRLANGIDPMLHELSRTLVDEASRDQWDHAVELAQDQYIFEGMPVQDAIDLTTFILETTIGSSRFLAGSPACGGPLWVAVITKQEGFKWIEKPEWKVT